MRWLVFLLIFFPLTNHGAEIFYEDYENMSLCNDGSCNWKRSNSGDGPSSSCSVSSAFATKGNKSLKCSVTYPNTTRREVVLVGEPKSYYHLKQGNEYWIGQSYYIPKWPDDGNKITTISQVHQRTDQCDQKAKFPLQIAVQHGQIKVVIRAQKGTEACSNGHETHFNKSVYPIIIGEWFDIVINYKPDVNGNGKVKMWINNNLVVNYSGNVSYNNEGDDYWKHGLYRSACADPTQLPCTVPTRELYLDEFRILQGKDLFDQVSPMSNSSSQERLDPPKNLLVTQ